MDSCCTCATILSQTPQYAPQSEKPYPETRTLNCCARRICGKCIHDNARFAFYCPYCQISSEPSSSSLPLHGLREPPSYESATDRATNVAAPPPYIPTETAAVAASVAGVNDDKSCLVPNEESKRDDVQDTLHFLNHEHDTIPSLSLRYKVPAHILRRTNNLMSDHLLLARRTILIPSSHYTACVSLSPRPVEGEEEELRRNKIRRWMVGCKVADYDVAIMYLEREDWDLSAAMESWFDDERWERDNPLLSKQQRGTMQTGSTAGTRTRASAARSHRS